MGLHDPQPPFDPVKLRRQIPGYNGHSRGHVRRRLLGLAAKDAAALRCKLGDRYAHGRFEVSQRLFQCRVDHLIGAIDAPMMRWRSSALATKPFRFISSTKSRSVVATWSPRLFATPIACRITMKRSSSRRNPPVFAASPSSYCFTPAATSSHCSRNVWTTVGEVGARTISACFNSRVRRRS